MILTFNNIQDTTKTSTKLSIASYAQILSYQLY